MRACFYKIESFIDSKKKKKKILTKRKKERKKSKGLEVKLFESVQVSSAECQRESS